ncbi:hypothetical protein BJ508DRAFT_314156 [Ascobolus immersus RN42]|uniref:Uncharacterized protein n=1 Tax=Ascobolus immersus RN42 TaxID=1160509 RepID=A0A3N4HTQ9_ASCIM|nr:hypothetical protein BJ508DRAFT_314156 [Ascobolus immersus RN42]
MAGMTVSTLILVLLLTVSLGERQMYCIMAESTTTTSYRDNAMIQSIMVGLLSWKVLKTYCLHLSLAQSHPQLTRPSDALVSSFQRIQYRTNIRKILPGMDSDQQKKDWGFIGSPLFEKNNIWGGWQKHGAEPQRIDGAGNIEASERPQQAYHDQVQMLLAPPVQLDPERESSLSRRFNETKLVELPDMPASDLLQLAGGLKAAYKERLNSLVNDGHTVALYRQGLCRVSEFKGWSNTMRRRVVELRAFTYRLVKVLDLLILRSQIETPTGQCQTLMLEEVERVRTRVVDDVEGLEFGIITPIITFCIEVELRGIPGGRGEALYLQWNNSTEDNKAATVPLQVDWYTTSFYQTYKLLLRDIPYLGYSFSTL